MEYDFSKIKTEELRRAVDNYNGSCACNGIDCNDCPFILRNCNTDNRNERHNQLKEELNRREKMENKMPTIVSGMVVEKEWYDGDIGRYLIVDTFGMRIDSDVFCSDISEDDIIKVYEIREECSFKELSLDENLKLIWSKKSDKDIKIEELEKKVEFITEEYNKSVEENREEFNRNMKELNSQIQELKG